MGLAHRIDMCEMRHDYTFFNKERIDKERWVRTAGGKPRVPALPGLKGPIQPKFWSWSFSSHIYPPINDRFCVMPVFP